MGLEIGPLHVRRSAFINASPARVWKEFETPDAIRGWLDSGHQVHVFEPQVGGKVDLSIEGEAGTRIHYGGPVVVVEPERELSVEIAWHGESGASMFWTFRLTPVYDGTLVELFHHGFERAGVDAADQVEGYEGGWDNHHLRDLRAIVEQ